VFAQGEALAQQHEVGIKGGMLGIGVEYGYSFTERLAVRGLLYGSSYSFDSTESGIDYDFVAQVGLAVRCRRPAPVYRAVQTDGRADEERQPAVRPQHA
jgi:hypothetical protein